MARAGGLSRPPRTDPAPQPGALRARGRDRARGLCRHRRRGFARPVGGRESSLQITLRGLGSGSLLDIANSGVDRQAAYQDFQAKAAANVGQDPGDRYREQGRYGQSQELPQ